MKLWLLWVVATAVAFGVGGRLGVALSPSRDLIVTGYIAMTGSILLAGVLQWLVLRRLLDDTASWMLASVTAVAVIGVVVFGAGTINRDVGWVLGVVVGWIVLGVLQWLVLRAQVPRAGWWVLASTLGLVLAPPRGRIRDLGHSRPGGHRGRGAGALAGVRRGVRGGDRDGAVVAVARALGGGDTLIGRLTADLSGVIR